MTILKFAGMLLLAGGAGIFISLVIIWVLRSIAQWRHGIKNDKLVAAKFKELEEFKAKGDNHDWIDWVNPASKEIMHICKKTGYCPSIDGFINEFFIKMLVEQKKFKKEYADFKENRIKTLSQQYSLDIFHMERLVESTCSIKKDFHVMKLGQLSEELKQKGVSEGVEDMISDMKDRIQDATDEK